MLTAGLLLMATAGCATNYIVQDDTSFNDEGFIIRQSQTRNRVTTFFDAKSDLKNVKAITSDKTQSLAIGSLANSSSGTNAVGALQEIYKIMLLLK